MRHRPPASYLPWTERIAALLTQPVVILGCAGLIVNLQDKRVDDLPLKIMETLRKAPH